MMTFIKHNSLQATGCCLLFVCHRLTQRIINRRLVHDQRVICDNKGGVAGSALVLFDEATFVVRTGHIDAFAATIREA